MYRLAICSVKFRGRHLPKRKIVAIGASAGGVEALTTIIGSLPADFPAPIAVVMHIPAESPSFLPAILSRRGALQAKHAEDGETLRNGVVYVAPPDRHILIDPDLTVRTPRGPRENRHRPAVDPLFRSAALAFGSHAIGTVLSGNLDDGTAGLIAIKKCGGIAIVQDPDEAMYPGMPQNAIEHVDVDHVLPLSLIGEQLVRSVNEDRPAVIIEEPQMVLEKKIAEFTAEGLQGDERPGAPSPFSCPDCGGVLWQIDDDNFVRYRCRVGHAFSPETMLSAQGEVLEEAMMTALKTLEESARLANRLFLNEKSRGHDWIAKRFAEREREARDRAEIIRKFIASNNSTVPVEARPAKKRR
jgi:two-component system chemotaxis response regulator CheB